MNCLHVLSHVRIIPLPACLWHTSPVPQPAAVLCCAGMPSLLRCPSCPCINPAAQDELHKRYKHGSALQMMCWMNFWWVMVRQVLAQLCCELFCAHSCVCSCLQQVPPCVCWAARHGSLLLPLLLPAPELPLSLRCVAGAACTTSPSSFSPEWART